MEKKQVIVSEVKDEKQEKEMLLKSKAKAAGVKSTLVLSENELLVTTFGKGNTAISEKYVKEKNIHNLVDPSTFDMKENGRFFDIKGNAGIKTCIDNPLYNDADCKGARKDLIGCKDVLEKEYFGKTFEDNIHIQMIYNILDIKKILSFHINNIVYSINNVCGTVSADDDFIGIGYLTLRNDYATYCNPVNLGKTVQNNIRRSKEVFDRLVNNDRLSYFGTAFYNKEHSSQGAKNKPKCKPKGAKEIYYILATLNEVRQNCFHGLAADEGKSNIYKIEDSLNDSAKDVINKIYENKLSELNSFTNNSSKSNFRILFDALGIKKDEEKQALAKDYYNFTVRKSYKNVGFSIKKIRETIISDSIPRLTNTEYDSVRSKFYQLFDFVIWNYFKHHEEKGADLVRSLRSSLCEEDKEIKYKDASKDLWPCIKGSIEQIENVLLKIKNEKIKIKSLGLSEAEKSLVKKAVNEVKISADVSWFSKIIYLLTLFLDGKEINDLLTTLRNKFENIASFDTVLKEQNLKCRFTDAYELFERSKDIAGELAEINSFARMSSKDSGMSKKVMFLDAAYMLGVSVDGKELEKYLDKNILDKKKLKKLSNGRVDTGLRNFIISNVIESSRFKYLVRYTDAKAVKKYMQNNTLVKFALQAFPDDQLKRYYIKVLQKNDRCEVSRKEMLGALSQKLAKVNFYEFSGVNQRANAEENKEKASKLSLVSLYLNVAYQVVKNLVYINSRYTTALHCYERDYRLIEGTKTEKFDAHLTERFINENRINKYASEYLRTNIANADEGLLRNYRNKIAHLNAVRNFDKYISDIHGIESYYALYHYAMQRLLFEVIDEGSLSEKSKQYKADLLSHGTYRKDLVKALNVPFGYNLPRYKNLSIDGLFDKNIPGERGCIEPKDE